MNVSSWLKKANCKDADLILLNVKSFFLKQNFDKTWLVTHGEDELEEKELDLANQWLERSKNGEPLAYITHHKEFYGRDFLVSPEVLIPRPETETIIDIVKELSPKKIIDVGTGSGCIAITCALENKNVSVVGLDISEKALNVAEKNAENLQAKVDFLKSDLLENYHENCDLVIANLPYVDKNWHWLSDNLKFEPSLALYAEDNGLALIKKLLDQIKKYQNCKNLILEADPSQHQEIIEYAKKINILHQKTQDFILLFSVKR